MVLFLPVVTSRTPSLSRTSARAKDRPKTLKGPGKARKGTCPLADNNHYNSNNNNNTGLYFNPHGALSSSGYVSDTDTESSDSPSECSWFEVSDSECAVSDIHSSSDFSFTEVGKLDKFLVSYVSLAE